MRRWILPCLLLLALFPVPVRAEPVADLDAPAYGGDGPTFRHLVHAVFGDAVQDPVTCLLTTDSEKILRRPGRRTPGPWCWPCLPWGRQSPWTWPTSRATCWPCSPAAPGPGAG